MLGDSKRCLCLVCVRRSAEGHSQVSQRWLGCCWCWDRAGPPARVRPGQPLLALLSIYCPLGWEGAQTPLQEQQREAPPSTGCSGDAEPPQQRETFVCPKKRLFQTLLECGESLLWLFGSTLWLEVPKSFRTQSTVSERTCSLEIQNN